MAVTPRRSTTKRISYAESSDEDDKAARSAGRTGRKAVGKSSKSTQSQRGSAKGRRRPNVDAEDDYHEGADEEDDQDVEDDELDAEMASEEESDEYLSEDDRPKKRKRATPRSRPTSAKSSVKRTSAAGDADDTPTKNGKSVGDGEYLIRKLAARSAGKTPYAPHTLHPNTLLFLRELKANNERDWFAQNELRYKQAKEDFESFVLSYAARLRELDDEIPDLPVKDLTFRIFRDIRFSNDRTPYKTHFSAALSRTGRKGNYACYYIHVEPGGLTQLNCGVWHPEAADLKKVRRFIHRDPRRLLAMFKEEGFAQFFGGRQAITSTEDQLKTCPKGYDKSHPQIDLLKCKTFRIRFEFKDAEVVDRDFLQIVAAVNEPMVPFVHLMNSVINPAAGEPHYSESSEDEADDEEGGEEEDP